MAETIRTEITTERRTTSGTTHRTARVTTVVRSIHGRDVSVIRDFVAALDAASAPSRALVDCTRSDAGHLTGLSVRWSTEVPDAEAAPAADEPEVDRG